MDGIAPNPQQQERDACGQRDICAACGLAAEPRNPLVIAADGYRVHVKHVNEQGDGYWGVPFGSAA
jgi:hypothetical protein